MRHFFTQYRDELTQWTGPDIEAENWEAAQTIADRLSKIDQAIEHRSCFIQVVGEKNPVALEMIVIEILLDDGTSFKITSEAPTIAAAFCLAASHCAQANQNILEMRLCLEEATEPPELW